MNTHTQTNPTPFSHAEKKKKSENFATCEQQLM